MSTPFSPQEVAAFRADFPFIKNTTESFDPPLAYLDSGATSQKPLTVLDTERWFLEHQNSSVHRGASANTGEATLSFEGARERLAEFVGATSSTEIVFTAGATDSLNLIAQGIAEANTSLYAGEESPFILHPGDEILVTEAEHHANLIPWQRLAKKTGATLRYIPVNEHGTWSLIDVQEALTEKTKIFAFAHVSNVTGFVAPVAEITELTRHRGVITVLDACQSVPHIPVDFKSLGVDFAAWSGHKMLGPNGIGLLYGRAELLAELPPTRTGGSAITTVSMEEAEFLPIPHRFEAGTAAVSQVIALGAATKYLQEAQMQRVAATEKELVDHMVQEILATPGLRLLGPLTGVARAALAAVEVAGIHAHDVGQVLDGLNVQVRVGHHCAQPLHRALGINSSVRASVHLTSTLDEVDRFIAGLKEAMRYFGAKN